jgi:hypothetical protein
MKVNNILVSSWGYDQTNVNFYEVVRMTEKWVFVRELEKTDTYFYSMSGQTLPQEGNYKGSVFRRLIRNGAKAPYINIHSCMLARLWDGKPRFFSEYA